MCNNIGRKVSINEKRAEKTKTQYNGPKKYEKSPSEMFRLGSVVIGTPHEPQMILIFSKSGSTSCIRGVLP